MLLIHSISTDPQFNLAAEEYLFKNFEEDIFFLYVNEPSVVVGKHQNALAEINRQFVIGNGIHVIRRLSGGGAVYHDLGNFNFSFHQTVTDTSKISYKTFNIPIVAVLQELSVTAEISKRNDISVEGFKVSGHAEHVFRNRILSHGTLLFSSNKEDLSNALKNNSGTFSGKAIPSVRSKVANISDFLKHPMEIDQLVERMKNKIVETTPNCSVYQFSSHDNIQIEKLVEEKYATWEWNYGYSPKYRFEKEIVVDGKGLINIVLDVEKGMIVGIKIESDVLSDKKRRAIQNKLLNSPHEFNNIMCVLLTLDILPVMPFQLAECFF